MLSPDPIKRGLNPYPYCDNDPANYVDPTGEIPTVLAGGLLGCFFGGGAGFLESALSQAADGGKIDWRKAAGAAANGAVTGAARGTLIGSGAGIPLAFATDFTAGSIGDALEQGFTTGKVNLGKSLIGGAENALSQMLYGTGELKSAGEAFAKGFGVGAVSSGLRNIEDALWPEDSRDPKRMCGSPNPFDLTDGLGNGRGYHSGRGHGGAGFSFFGLLKDMVIGGIVGGVSSAGFYGAGKAVKALHESLVGRRHGRGSRFPENPNDLFPENYVGLNKEVRLDGKINYTVQAGGKTYRIEYHPKHGGTGHYNGNHYHVLKLGEFSKPGKAKPPYFRIPNFDPNTPTKRGGGTFAPGDLFPTKNK